MVKLFFFSLSGWITALGCRGSSFFLNCETESVVRVPLAAPKKNDGATISSPFLCPVGKKEELTLRELLAVFSFLAAWGTWGHPFFFPPHLLFLRNRFENAGR